ncbi:hypothetical protein K469DRAFT_716630 [Zopfia rhizophila CBS 207.26]|uniref:Heterokaryon incompatibility domain-containing protein n=1 Tax=Zopfia rhizophila CBS 207.26 TaxID=1314779 RepID=A0A6A6ELU8_9PEZI|nr:hypothetical protein K469DRAFT_716630 [Zopfia rhizophila CBS 207.26]
MRLQCLRPFVRHPLQGRSLKYPLQWPPACRTKILANEHFSLTPSYLHQALESVPTLQINNSPPSDESTNHDVINTMYPQRLDSAKHELRLLYLNPRIRLSAQRQSEEDEDIHVRLEVASCKFDQEPRFEALSYTHGQPYDIDPKVKRHDSEKLHDSKDPSTTRCKHIFINGVRFPVTLNLFNALHRIRDLARRHPRLMQTPFWVDTICINQSDSLEREEQVRLMGEIYRKANGVLIWLGNDAEPVQTRMALDVIKDIFRGFNEWYDLRNSEGSFLARWEEISRAIETTPDAIDQKHLWNELQSDVESWISGLDIRNVIGRSDERPWLALGRLLSRSWFGRVWTWQEKELARNATILIGDTIIPWAELRFAMLVIMVHDLSESRGTPHQVMPGQQYLRVLDNLDLGNCSDLLDLVINVRHRRCTLPHDKIFSVLGAADPNSPSVQHFCGKINYDKPIQELYQEFSRWWIEEKKDLRVLQACSLEQRELKGLPTWVADWSDTTPSRRLASSLYRASGTTQVEARYVHSRPAHISKKIGQFDEMILKGIPIDRIKIVCHDPRLSQFDTFSPGNSGEWNYHQRVTLQPYSALYVSGHRPGLVDSLVSQTWLELEKELKWNKPYSPTGQTMAEAYWRTLLEDHNPHSIYGQQRRIPLDVDLTSVFHNWAERRALTRSLRGPRSHADDDELSPKWLERLQRTLRGKRIFITEKGFLGLAPSNVKTGDVVCVLLGGNVPFSIRPHRQMKKRYTYMVSRLVEETYLHGFMDGRAVEMAEKGKLPYVEFWLR